MGCMHGLTRDTIRSVSTTTTDPAAVNARLRRDPVAFSEVILGRQLWDRQREILRAVRDHPRVAVKSGNGVGKSDVAADAALHFALLHPDARVLLTGPAFHTLKANLWAHIGKRIRKARLPEVLGRDRLLEGLRDRKLLIDGETWSIEALSTDDPSSFQGRHAPHVLVILDEAQAVEAEIWEAAESLTVGGNGHILAIGNPLVTVGRFYDCFNADAHRWHQITISCWDHPNVTTGKVVIPGCITREVIEERKESWETAAPGLYQARVLGEFPSSGETSVVPRAFLEKGAALEIKHATDAQVHLGLDVARAGTDQCVLSILKGGDITKPIELLEQIAWGGMDFIDSAQRVVNVVGELKTKGVDIPAHRIHVEHDGIGSAVVENLHRLHGLVVDAVHVGGLPQGEWGHVVGRDTMFKNRKAELWWAVRCLLMRGLLKIPKRFKEAWNQMPAHTYKYTPTGQIQIEEKDKVKERIGRSPDHADSIVVGLSRMGISGPLLRIMDRRDIR